MCFDSSIVFTLLLEFILSDVLTSRVLSCDGYNNYVIFDDRFTKYILLYILQYKSDVLNLFTRFKPLVEKSLNHPIKNLYTDNKDEYLALKSYLGYL